MHIPGFSRTRNMESTRAASGTESAETASTKKSLGKDLKKFGTQIRHGVRDAIKNLNNFSNKLSAKVHDVPRPSMQEATKVAASEINRQDAAFQSKFNGPQRMERPSVHVPHKVANQQAEQQQPVRTQQESPSAQWARIKVERGQREREVNLLKFDICRRHPGEIKLDRDIIPRWDTNSRDKADALQKKMSAAEMKLSRYIHGETHIDIRGALHEIKAAEDGMQSLLKSVQQREKAEASKRVESERAGRHSAENEAPEWNLWKIPPWNRELKRKVDELLTDYHQQADYDDDYGMVEMQRQMAKLELDDIFRSIAEREKTEARVMRNVNAGY